MSSSEESRDITVTPSFSTSQKKLIKLKHKWTIENFHFYLLDTSVTSPVFNAGVDDGIQWYLKLYPNGNNESNKGYVSAFLHLCSTSPKSVLSNGRILIITADQLSPSEMAARKPVRIKPGCGKGYMKFIKVGLLLEDRLRFLPNNGLTLFCEVWYTVDGAEVSKPTSPLRVKAPERALLEALEQLYESKILSDVVLTVGETKIKAHRAILAVRSPFFKAMFRQGCAQGEIPRVEVSDMHEETLIELLRFIYTGKAKSPAYMAELLASIDRHMNLVSIADSTARETEIARRSTHDESLCDTQLSRSYP